MKPIPLEAINKTLTEAMDQAAANGANSISMPDHYVELAYFLCYPQEFEVEQMKAEISVLHKQLAAKQDELDDWIHTNKIDELYRQLAAERLRVDTGLASDKSSPLCSASGCSRYENANLGQKLARDELARINGKAAEPDYVEIASACGYTVEATVVGKFFYVTPWLSYGQLNYSTREEAFKAACEDNNLMKA